MIRILQISEPGELRKIMSDIGVDPYGSAIMLPKAVNYLIRMNSVSNIAANILKQEMLSLGGDVAVARGALTGKIKKTDCLLIGNLSQLLRLKQKLKLQPFGLSKLADALSDILKNYQRDRFVIELGRFRLDLSKRTHIMGIVNLTPDSFSGDGLYRKPHSASPFAKASGDSPSKLEERRRTNRIAQSIEYVEQLVEDGADIIDVGGESSRPGARPVSLKEELERTISVIKALNKKIKVPMSIDTYKPEVARLALDNGAAIVNDITALKDPRMAMVVKKYKAGVVIMHMKGNPRTMQNNPAYASLIDEVIEYIERAINRALSYGIDKEKIIIDPGIGFGKLVSHNLELLKKLADFKVLGRPILVGPSRKSFIGKLLNVGAQERIFGTVSTCVLAAQFGANIVRVHDVKEVKQALKVSEAITYGA